MTVEDFFGRVIAELERAGIAAASISGEVALAALNVK